MQLDIADRQTFEELKQAIRDGMAQWLVVGESFIRIKEARYYEADGYKTFEDFVVNGMCMTSRHARQMMDDKKTYDSLPPSHQKLVKSARAARQLGKIDDPGMRVAVLELASGGGEKSPSASDIKNSTPPPRPKPEEKKGSTPPPKRKAPPAPARKPVPKLPKDKTGLLIPRELLPLWERRNEGAQLLGHVSSLRTALSKAQDSTGKVIDQLYAEIDFSGDLAKLNQVWVDLKQLEPYAVCPSCQGKIPKGCRLCHERGFVSQFRWEHVCTEEQRDLRATAVEQQDAQ